jgi:hypothetical protein
MWSQLLLQLSQRWESRLCCGAQLLLALLPALQQTCP